MGEKGNPYENAIAERINGILKSEYLDHMDLGTQEAAHNAVLKTVGLYNNHRLHSSINYLKPSDAHMLTGEIPRKWKNREFECQK